MAMRAKTIAIKLKGRTRCPIKSKMKLEIIRILEKITSR